MKRVNVEGRPDHHEFYVPVVCGLSVLALTMMLVGVPTATLVSWRLAPYMQLILACTLFLACVLCDTGMMLGTRWFKVGADIRLCYKFGAAGDMLMALTIWIYTVRIARHAAEQAASVTYVVGQAVWPALLGLAFALIGRRLLIEVHNTEARMPLIKGAS